MIYNIIQHQHWFLQNRLRLTWNLVDAFLYSVPSVLIPEWFSYSFLCRRTFTSNGGESSVTVQDKRFKVSQPASKQLFQTSKWKSWHFNVLPAPRFYFRISPYNIQFIPLPWSHPNRGPRSNSETTSIELLQST